MATLKLIRDLVIGQTDPRLFSSFLEHLGRAIYTGIYEPSHPSADNEGFRQDVLEQVKALHLEYIRYPGGNFVSGYNWKDGVGDHRPARLDLAWRTLEPNTIGINEFKMWCDRADVQIMGAVNLGTGTPKDAAELVEYCNFPAGTTLSDWRISHGYPEPLDIKLWCLGNEMDGEWQIGHLNAEDYAKKAREAAKMMKWVDPQLELVVVGSSSPMQPTFPEWDRQVLEATYEQVDYISLHRYYWNEGNDQDFVTCHADFDHFIKTVAATVDYVKALKRSDKTIYLSVDEWNIWYLKDVQLKDWEKAPEILEDHYSFLDALAFSGLVITLLNNCDRVKIACLAQLVNVIAPIMTRPNGDVIKQTIYYPFYFFSNFGRGQVLQTLSQSSKLHTVYGESNAVVCAAVLDEQTDELNLFVLNADLSSAHSLEFEFTAFGSYDFIERWTLHEFELNAKNTFESPERVVPHHATEFNPVLPAGSFSLFRFKLDQEPAEA